ncbi:hypothetical protein C0993_005864 [Termitomyces sp. T159_Od127]|nr:hypothetical protein C0993_005864 [Termitomyces sp. T159_Od127]
MPWNPSKNSNWQNGAAAGNQTTSAALPPNPAAWPPLGQGPANINQTPGPCPQTQLNAANTQEAPDPNQTKPDLPTDPHNTLDYADDKEALCASWFRNWPWIDTPEETQEKRRHEGACMQGHFINKCPKHQVVGRAVWAIDGKDCDFWFMENDPVV